ncbi:MAG: hypothetical protein OHK0029_06820 [Armatimonadaceae bacterium]
MTQKKFTALMVSVFGTLGLMGAGCTQDAQQDLSQAGNQMERAGENIGEATAKSAAATGEAIEEGAERVGEGVEDAARMTGEAVGGAVNDVAEGAEDVGAKIILTPTVKAALVADERVDASTLNVETNQDMKTVTILGTQKTQAQVQMVTNIAQQALRDNNSAYKVVNKVTVGKM